MVVGQNCRFLQSPTGKLEGHSNISDNIAQSGAEPKHGFDNKSVRFLREMIAARNEVQVPLRNFRRDGSEFANLITAIPLWDGDRGDTPAYYVGFQGELTDNVFAP
jgi:hypothetical protein